MSQSKSKQTYLVTLTPSEHFFFGGEITFGADQQDTYLVKSNYFPQQTSLLGVLRFALLQQANLLTRSDRKLTKTEREEARELIGGTSFRASNRDNNYGKIQCISPVFLSCDNNSFLPAPFDRGFELIATANGRSYTATTINSLYTLKDYSSKNGYDEKLISENAIRHFTPTEKEKGVFIPAEQVGIKKAQKGEARTEAYYKQTFYRLETGFSFAFYVDLDADFTPSTTPQLVVFGGERKTFQLAFHKQAQNLPLEQRVQIPVTDKSGKLSVTAAQKVTKLVLVSDSYVPNTIYEHCALALTETKPFRYIQSSVETKRYANLVNEDGANTDFRALQFSPKHTLLSRGSVLYVKTNALHKVENELKSNQAFRQIGYNYYQTF